MWGFFPVGSADAWVIVTIKPSTSATDPISIVHIFKRTQHRADAYATEAIQTLVRHFAARRIVMECATLSAGRLASRADAHLVSGTLACGTFEFRLSP